MKTSRKMFVKSAFGMTKLKRTFHKCESVHICHWHFPRIRYNQAHIANYPCKAITRLQCGALRLTLRI